MTIKTRIVIAAGIAAAIAAPALAGQAGFGAVPGAAGIPNSGGIALHPESVAAAVGIPNGDTTLLTAVGAGQSSTGGLLVGVGSGTTGPSQSGVGVGVQAEKSGVGVSLGLAKNNQVALPVQVGIGNQGVALNLAGKPVNIPLFSAGNSPLGGLLGR